MNKKLKVLFFVDRLGQGGVQTLLYDWVNLFDRDIIKVDFLVLDDGNTYDYEETLKQNGFNVYKLHNMWIKNPFDYIKYAFKLNNFFKNHSDYDIVHLHASSKNYQVMKYAKKYNIPVRISHSHNIDFQTKSLFRKKIGNIFKRFLIKYSTHYFACSKMAGEWLFGSEIINSDKFYVIHNAVDYDKFAFNNKVRNRLRKELNIDDNTFVIGHVGRFVNQKNHNFLIDIFAEVYKKNKNYKLMLVGTGEKEPEIKDKVKELNLSDAVLFMGIRNDVNELMSVMDMLLMPSLHEGLPVVGIEAQASGLPCLMSDTITPEVKVTDSVSFASLDESAVEWAKKIFVIKQTDRKDNYNSIKEKKYIISDIAQMLMDLYLKFDELVEKNEKN